MLHFEKKAGLPIARLDGLNEEDFDYDVCRPSARSLNG